MLSRSAVSAVKLVKASPAIANIPNAPPSVTASGKGSALIAAFRSEFMGRFDAACIDQAARTDIPESRDFRVGQFA